VHAVATWFADTYQNRVMTGVMAISSTHPNDVRLFTSVSGNHYINLCEIRK